MASGSEPAVREPMSQPGSRARLRKWATRRGRQLGLVVLALSVVLGLVAGAGLVRRWACLMTLPDVGEGFAAPAAGDGPIPAERDAFVLFRQAAAKAHPRAYMPDKLAYSGPFPGWSEAGPQAWAWVEANREALELFRKAAEQADGRAHPFAGETALAYDRVLLVPFVGLSLLEASRLEEQGDMPGAWGWYRALLGMRAHLMRRGTVFERFIASANCEPLKPRVALWAADPRTRAADLRRALDDLLACGPRPEWDAASLKVDYLLAARELDRTNGPTSQGDDADRAYRIAGEPLPPNLAQTAYALRRFLDNEPERSRRVLRLAYANWLAHVEIPGERQRKPAVRAVFPSFGSTTGVDFYAPGPAAPASSRALAPEDLARWLLTAPDAKLLLNEWPWPSVNVREHQQHRALVILLAEELYRRERGQSPPSEDALVGPYLKGLPDDGTGDLDDGTVPRVEAPPKLPRE